MFISEFEKEKSLWNVMSEMSKKEQVSKDWFNCVRWAVINSLFSYFLLVSLFVSRDSISLILKENNFISVFQLISPETHLEPNRTSMMECFPRIVNG